MPLFTPWFRRLGTYMAAETRTGKCGALRGSNGCSGQIESPRPPADFASPKRATTASSCLQSHRRSPGGKGTPRRVRIANGADRQLPLTTPFKNGVRRQLTAPVRNNEGAKDSAPRMGHRSARCSSELEKLAEELRKAKQERKEVNRRLSGVIIPSVQAMVEIATEDARSRGTPVLSNGVTQDTSLPQESATQQAKHPAASESWKTLDSELSAVEVHRNSFRRESSLWPGRFSVGSSSPRKLGKLLGIWGRGISRVAPMVSFVGLASRPSLPPCAILHRPPSNQCVAATSA